MFFDRNRLRRSYLFTFVLNGSAHKLFVGPAPVDIAKYNDWTLAPRPIL
jgi:hypothetical protein